MEYPNSINANLAQMAEQLNATMAALIQELKRQLLPLPPKRTDNQLKNHANPKSDHKVLICGYSEDEDCLCVATESMEPEYDEMDDLGEVVLDCEEDDVNQIQLQNQLLTPVFEDDRDLFVHEAEDHEILQATLEHPSPPIPPFCIQLIHDKLSSLTHTDYSSPTLSANTAIGTLCIIANEVFDKSLQGRGYLAALNPDPPDDYGPDGNERLAYGGDFGHISNDANYCLNGIMWSDRNLNPAKRKASIKTMISHNDYNNDGIVKEFSIQVMAEFTSSDARVLNPPRLMYPATGRDSQVEPWVGQWNMINKKMVHGGTVDFGACVNFSWVKPDVANSIYHELVSMCCSRMVFNPQLLLPIQSANPRGIEKALLDIHFQFAEKLKNTGKHLQMLIVILPDVNGFYGRIKRICETELGIILQCCQSKQASKCDKQYIENVSLKISVKVGEHNTVLASALERRIPFVSDRPIIIFGADVTHPQPGEDFSPSIAASVESMDLPEATKYRGLVSAHDSGEIIKDLYNSSEDTQRGLVHRSMIRDFLIAFKKSTNHKPHRIIFYRNGVGEGQFNEVLLEEMDVIQKACQSPEENYLPPVTFVVVQKKHHTRLFANHNDHKSTYRSGNILPYALHILILSNAFQFIGMGEMDMIPLIVKRSKYGTPILSIWCLANVTKNGHVLIVRKEYMGHELGATMCKFDPCRILQLTAISKQEKHYVFKLHFSWPQVSTISECPFGSKTVFASHKEHVGLVQRFAIQFLSFSESQAFLSSLKESLNELISANEMRHIADVALINGYLAANYSPSPDSFLKDGVQNTCYEETTLHHDYEDIFAPLPLIFTEFLSDGCTKVHQEPLLANEDSNMNTRIAKYMTVSSFNAMLIKLELINGVSAYLFKAQKQACDDADPSCYFEYFPP